MAYRVQEHPPRLRIARWRDHGPTRRALEAANRYLFPPPRLTRGERLALAVASGSAFAGAVFFGWLLVTR